MEHIYNTNFRFEGFFHKFWLNIYKVHSQKYKRMEVSLLAPVLLPTAPFIFQEMVSISWVYLEIFIPTQANVTCPIVSLCHIAQSDFWARKTGPLTLSHPAQCSLREISGPERWAPLLSLTPHNVPCAHSSQFEQSHRAWRLAVSSALPCFLLRHRILQGAACDRHTLTPVAGPVLCAPGWNCRATACLLIIFTTILKYSSPHPYLKKGTRMPRRQE